MLPIFSEHSLTLVAHKNVYCIYQDPSHTLLFTFFFKTNQKNHTSAQFRPKFLNIKLFPRNFPPFWMVRHPNFFTRTEAASFEAALRDLRDRVSSDLPSAVPSLRLVGRSSCGFGGYSERDGAIWSLVYLNSRNTNKTITLIVL